MALVTLKNLSFTYPNAEQHALDGLSLTIEQGEFITLMGATGSGKSTLLRLLKPELRQNGAMQGEILYEVGRCAPFLQSLSHRSVPPSSAEAADPFVRLADISPSRGISFPKGSLNMFDIGEMDAHTSARKIGFVAQNPEEQIVTDKVWHELAFTLENFGTKQKDIARRVAEISSYFGIDSWMKRDTATLSGGEKQLVNLAAVMIADPELLLLDEPTAQLDPIAAARLIETVYRLNRETGVTVIMSEHRCEELFPIADRIVILDKGRVMYDDAPRKVAEQIGTDSAYEAFLPTAARLYHLVGGSKELPLSVREGQRFVGSLNVIDRKEPSESNEINTDEALSLKNIRFRYERKGADILRDLDLTVYQGEVFALLGANGAGKSTAAAVIAGLRKPYCGTVKLFGRPLKDYKNGSLYRENISLLPQDTESVFIHETVREELKGCEEVLEKLPYDLNVLFDRHPYDISGGERQLVALCKALSTKPRFLIMDEPSKGLDENAKGLLQDVIRRLKAEGVTILLITHDVEFAALCADRCALFAQGRIAAADGTERFMSDNRFYTTAASRITRRFVDGAYTAALAAERFTYDGGAL